VVDIEVQERAKLYDALVRALDDATEPINTDKRTAAEAYLRISKDKDSVQDILAMLNDPAIVFTTTPQNVMKYVEFMHRIGAIKSRPDSWKDLFFPNAHSLPGG
jgi:NitT/TauT family transport system substrate-binding protein